MMPAVLIILTIHIIIAVRRMVIKNSSLSNSLTNNIVGANCVRPRAVTDRPYNSIKSESPNSSLSDCSYNHYKGFTCRLQVLFAAGAGVFLFFLCVLLFFLKSKPFGIVIECIFKLFTCKCESISICITIGI